MTKYRAQKTIVDNIVFDSKAEARRYAELKLLEGGGLIRDLSLQQQYDLDVNGTRVGRYVADFVYLDNETGERVVEDVKGVRTPVYRLKKKMMKAIYGIEITEVEA